MTSDAARQKALKKISGIAARHRLGVAEISHALQNPSSLEPAKDPARGKSFIVGLLTYLGGALIAAGYFIYVGIAWEDTASLPRVILTLGMALTALVIALALHKDFRYAKAATPVFMLALFSEPGGLFVMLKEYGSGDDVLLASVVVFGIMALQCLLLFITVRRAVMLFFALLYALAWYGFSLEYMHINEPLLWLGAGITYLYLGWRIQLTSMKVVSPLTLIAGQTMSLSGCYYYLGNTDADILMVTLILSMMVWAMYIGSRSLVVTSLLFFINLAGKYFLYGTDMYEATVYSYTAMGAAVSVLLTGHWIKSHFTGILSPVWYFFGSALLYAGGFGLVTESTYDILFPALPAVMLYTSLREKSRTLLATAIFALIGFIAYYTSMYFSDVLSWPLVLMGMGALIIFAGLFTYKTHSQFTSGR